MEKIETSLAPKAIGPYVQGNTVNGLFFASGQIALNPETGALVGENITEQTRQVMQNITQLLIAADSDLDHVIKTTCFLAHIEDFGDFNTEYATFFGSHFPARSTVEVSALPKGALVEVELIAEQLKSI